jgi:shikimate dehydrogenase
VTHLSGATKLCAVIGDPVSHSLSPILHNAAFEATGLDIAYLALHVLAGRGAEAVGAMRTLGLTGLSVTMPHKFVVAEVLDRLTPQAEALGSCNTVFRDGNDPEVLWGDSTDGEGFVNAVRATWPQFALTGTTAVVLGAGGAGRAVIEALGRAGVVDISVINRDPHKAERAASLSGAARVGVMSDVSAANLVVNATSLGMHPNDELPCDVSLLQPSHLVADLIYHPATTPFLSAAAATGARTMNGLPMLLHQAALQFRRWTGIDAPLPVMQSALEAELLR